MVLKMHLFLLFFSNFFFHKSEKKFVGNKPSNKQNEPTFISKNIMIQQISYETNDSKK